MIDDAGPDSRAGDDLRISTDRADLDIDWIHAALSERAYWALDRPRDVVVASIEGSVCFGAYRGSRQIGFARIVTDRATFGWVCDVFVDESERGQGVGGELLQAITTHPQLRGLKRLVLATRDAQSFYAQYGFGPLENPERFMIRRG